MAKQKPLIWYIHGAASTPKSFNWMKDRMPLHDAVDIEYDNYRPLSDTIACLREDALTETRPLYIMGHSLGGVIAASIAQVAPVKKIVTMGTPFGGSFAASIMRWFMPTQLFRDICQQSPVIASLRANPPATPIMSFVTDSGLTVMGERTDGVVTVSSQRALKGPDYYPVDTNHFEVLLSTEVAHEIKKFLFT